MRALAAVVVATAGLVAGGLSAPTPVGAVGDQCDRVAKVIRIEQSPRFEDAETGEEHYFIRKLRVLVYECGRHGGKVRVKTKPGPWSEQSADDGTVPDPI